MPARKASVKKTAARKAAPRKASVKKTAARKAAPRKASVKKTAARKAAPRKAAPARRAAKPPARAATPIRRTSTGAIRARRGDLIVIDSAQVGSPPREGEVLRVNHGEVRVSYWVKWADGHETLISPAAGTVTIVRA
jgi:acyl-CoA reductase-like NAD-dependent aldehyde dehydrogenase